MYSCPASGTHQGLVSLIFRISEQLVAIVTERHTLCLGG